MAEDTIPSPPETGGWVLYFTPFFLVFPFAFAPLSLRRIRRPHRWLLTLVILGLMATVGWQVGWAGRSIQLPEPSWSKPTRLPDSKARLISTILLRKVGEDVCQSNPRLHRWLVDGKEANLESTWNSALSHASPFGPPWEQRDMEVTRVRFENPPTVKRFAAQVDWLELASIQLWELRYAETREASATIEVVAKGDQWLLEAIEFH